MTFMASSHIIPHPPHPNIVVRRVTPPLAAAASVPSVPSPGRWWSSPWSDTWSGPRGIPTRHPLRPTPEPMPEKIGGFRWRIHVEPIDFWNYFMDDTMDVTWMFIDHQWLFKAVSMAISCLLDSLCYHSCYHLLISWLFPWETNGCSLNTVTKRSCAGLVNTVSQAELWVSKTSTRTSGVSCRGLKGLFNLYLRPKLPNPWMDYDRLW